jgi:hypothetical protein
VVRNRIYARVFDRAWVSKHMPDAELQRQRAAYRRGLLRATSVAAAVVAVIGMLAVATYRAELQARSERNNAVQAQKREQGQRLAAQQAAGLAREKSVEATRAAERARAAAERERRQKLTADAARSRAEAAQAEADQQRQTAVTNVAEAKRERGQAVHLGGGYAQQPHPGL